MKKSFTILAAALFVCVGVFAQSNTMYFVEEGTQASCGPCASQNPAFDALLDANSDKVVVLKYQTWWPGFDPMYLDNTSHVVSRINYYGINGVPTAVGNGAFWANDCGAWAGAPVCLSQAEIDAAYGVISPLTMAITGVVTDGVLQVTGTITADEALSGNLKLRIALTEQQISYDDAPGGSNGETEYHHVMKSFVGGPGGISLPDMAMGDIYSIDESLDIDVCGGVNIYQWNQLEVVAFVQDDADKTVYQASKDQDIPLLSSTTNNAISCTVSGSTSVICEGAQTISPAIQLTNGGSDELTSAMITYSINGGAEQTYSWSGSLETLGSEEVELDAYAFNAMALNTISATITEPNGNPDEDTSDNTVTSEFAAADAGETLNIEILTDNYGSETTWELLNPSGTVVLEGGPYGNATTYTDSYTVPSGESGCYEFKIYDAFGDGICCAWGDGAFTLSDGDDNVLIEGGEFQDETSANVGMSSASSLNEVEFSGTIQIGPNPVNDILNVRIEMDSQEAVLLEVMNSIGQKVYTESLGTLNGGTSLTEVDVKSLDAGIYFVNVVAGEATSTTKISVVK